MIQKYYVKFLKKLDILSSLSIRLVKLTGKHNYHIHPKHLIESKIWYEKYIDNHDVILDLGAGSCQNDLRIFHKVKKIICFDIDKSSIENAIKAAEVMNIKNINFIIGDANKKLPFKSTTFSKIICTDVLEHLYKRREVFTEINRVLKKNGYLFLLTDNPNTSWKKLQKSQGLFYYADRDHKYEYPKDEILKTLRKNHFKIISCKTSTYDTPFKGVIDFTGGISLTVYKKLRKWRENMAKLHPEETTGYKIIAQKT